MKSEYFFYLAIILLFNCKLSNSYKKTVWKIYGEQIYIKKINRTHWAEYQKVHQVSHNFPVLYFYFLNQTNEELVLYDKSRRLIYKIDSFSLKCINSNSFIYTGYWLNENSSNRNCFHGDFFFNLIIFYNRK
jgi:hypothetical protein